MSAVDLLNLLTEIFFIALGITSLVDYVLHRDPVRRDVAQLFTVLGLTVLIQFIAHVQGKEVSEGAGNLAIVGLILEPYLILRIVRHLRAMPDYMLRLALYAMFGTIMVGIITGSRWPFVAFLVGQLYLVGFNLYAMIGFVRGALKATGVVQRRLQCAAAGSGLFALIFVVAILAAIIPRQQEGILALGQPVAVACTFAFYIGFVPPRWLRRTWQLAELRDYLVEATHSESIEGLGVDDSLRRLCRSANQAVGGLASAVIQSDEAAATWTLREATDRAMAAQALDIGQSLIQNAMQQPSATFVYIPDVKDANEQEQLAAIGAETWLFVPMIVNKRLWGMLLVFLPGRSLFIDDDLSMLEILAQESAVVLTNYWLIAELQGYSEQLERKVEERTGALQESENRYRELNLALEQRVRERTMQLEAVNKEMEAFSYSVSHDLRAPLRSLDGFSQILNQDYAENLDEMGKSYLARIRAAAKKMAQLIDDLLTLASLNRNEMSIAPVDLRSLAGQIVTELGEQYPERKVEFVVEDELVVHGDSRLLQVALTNLLGNAWKYTSKQPEPRVELGVTEHEGQRAFFVRDNGAGFDMAYADKLFGVFQRLHGANEFPGSGIGLATVLRIINRHGGKIWAEGAVGKGATFFFTL